MNYSEFLFSQLFMEYCKYERTQYEDLAYDLMFPEILKHRELFLKSKFNVDTKSEYDCIVNYLSNKLFKED